MLYTFPVSFDHHFPRGGRDAFLAFVESFDASQSTPFSVNEEPVFTYSANPAAGLEILKNVDISRPQIRYLCNVVMHSALLVTGSTIVDAPTGLQSYNSLNAFLENPVVRGYHVDRQLEDTGQFNKSTVVISNLASSTFFDDETDEPDPRIFDVLDVRQLSVGQVFVCRILDYTKYFAIAGRTIEEQTYFIPEPARLTLKTCLKYYANERLTEFLFKQNVPFATMGDCHMDDDIIVTYREDFWRLPTSAIAFIR